MEGINKKMLITQAVKASNDLINYKEMLNDLRNLNTKLVRFNVIHSFINAEEDLQGYIKDMVRYIGNRTTPLLKLKEGEVMGEYSIIDDMVIGTQTYTELNFISKYEIETGYVIFNVINEKDNTVTRKRLLLNTGEVILEQEIDSI